MGFIAKHSKLLVLLFMGSLCEASPARVQISSSSIVGTSLVFNTGSVPNDNDNEIMAIGTSGSSAGSVTSILQVGATWQIAISTVNGSVETEIWYAEGVSGASTTITINVGTTLTIDANYVEYSGLLNSGSFDVSASSIGTLSVGSPFSGTTATTGQANEVWFASLTHQTVTSAGSSDFSSFTNSFSLTSQTTIGILKNGGVDKIVSSVGTANVTGSYTATLLADTWSGAIATFKAPSGGTASYQPLTLEGMGG